MGPVSDAKRISDALPEGYSVKCEAALKRWAVYHESQSTPILCRSTGVVRKWMLPTDRRDAVFAYLVRRYELNKRRAKS